MRAHEIMQLADWFDTHFANIQSAYEELLQVLEYNANHPDQQQIEPALNSLLAVIGEIRTQGLSIEQIEMLRKLEVFSLLGLQGASFVEQRVKDVAYDPATRVQEFQQMLSRLITANNHLSSFQRASHDLGLMYEPYQTSPDQLVVSVRFRDRVSIDNVPDLKNRTKDWYDITRGIALAAGETPDEVHVLGASRGSLIIEIACTLYFVRLLAEITTHITRAAVDIMEVRIGMEELKQKKILNALLAKELQRIEKEKKENALETVKEDIRKLFPKGVSGDVSPALDKSIEHLMTFLDKGGELDFKLPPDVLGPDTDTTDLPKKVAAVRKSILALHQERERIHQLESR